MSPDLSALLGYPATFLATIAFVPQAWQSWRTRDLSGLRGLLILSFSHSLILSFERTPLHSRENFATLSVSLFCSGCRLISGPGSHP